MSMESSNQEANKVGNDGINIDDAAAVADGNGNGNDAQERASQRPGSSSSDEVNASLPSSKRPKIAIHTFTGARMPPHPSTSPACPSLPTTPISWMQTTTNLPTARRIPASPVAGRDELAPLDDDAHATSRATKKKRFPMSSHPRKELHVLEFATKLLSIIDAADAVSDEEAT